MSIVLSIKEIENFLKTINVPMLGVTKSFRDERLANLLVEHHQAGHYIYFGETTLEQRQHIEAVFPVCKSIIVIGIPYESKNKAKAENNLLGFVSNMAWEYDYHTVVKSKLQALQEFLLSKDNGIEALIQVDTGPLIDRHIAFKSGLGAYGKNQCLMHESYGTEFYIGYLLVNRFVDEIQLGQDDLHDKRCNNCSKCVKACPSSVLTESFDFYGQRCISYLTQKKEHLNWEERELIGHSVYGCDICQLVCPSNNNGKVIPSEYKRKTLNRLELKDFLQKSNKKIMRDYKETGFSWRGAKVLKRNALIALANQKNEDNCAFLEGLLESANDYLLPYILWALCKSNYVRIGELCKKIFLESEDDFVKKECQSILLIL